MLIFSNLKDDLELLKLAVFCAGNSISESNGLVPHSPQLLSYIEDVSTPIPLRKSLAAAIEANMDSTGFYGLLISPNWPDKKLALLQTRKDENHDDINIINKSINMLKQWAMDNDDPYIGIEAPGLNQADFDYGPYSSWVKKLPPTWLIYYPPSLKPKALPENTPPKLSKILNITKPETFIAAASEWCQLDAKQMDAGFSTMFTNISKDPYTKLSQLLTVMGYLESIGLDNNNYQSRVNGWHQGKTRLTHLITNGVPQ